MTSEPFEAQQELFPVFSEGSKKPERFPSIAKVQKPILISTTLEQLLMVAIISVLVFCGVFFFGVLRGKALTRPILAPPLAAIRPSPPMSRPVGLPVPVAPPIRQAVPALKTSATVLAQDKPYSIQVVTHRKQEFASQEVAKLKRMGYVSFIIPSGEYFQVCAGQYATKGEASRDLASFKSKYKDCFLRHR